MTEEITNQIDLLMAAVSKHYYTFEEQLIIQSTENAKEIEQTPIDDFSPSDYKKHILEVIKEMEVPLEPSHYGTFFLDCVSGMMRLQASMEPDLISVKFATKRQKRRGERKTYFRRQKGVR